jgi:SAM-dependent methyltransferase
MTLPRSFAIATGLVALVAATAIAQSTTERKALDVPYVPTDERLVLKMLEVAQVNKNDLVYDLGSGDGRIVITAAQRFGTRGVGIDIDPQRVQEARENARRAGVADRVRFVVGDIFTADIGPATVVTMYLLPDVNMRLRPRLLSELRPGTRIVSHNYDLGDWKPARHLTMKVGTIDHEVFFWVVPPRAAGSR